MDAICICIRQALHFQRSMWLEPISSNRMLSNILGKNEGIERKPYIPFVSELDNLQFGRSMFIEPINSNYMFSYML